MKTLKDDTIVLSRTYYYLLEFKDAHLDIFTENFGDKRLSDLTLSEYKDFFELATKHDFRLLKYEQENF